MAQIRVFFQEIFFLKFYQTLQASLYINILKVTKICQVIF